MQACGVEASKLDRRVTRRLTETALPNSSKHVLAQAGIPFALTTNHFEFTPSPDEFQLEKKECFKAFRQVLEESSFQKSLRFQV